MPFPHSPSSFVTSSPEFKESPLLLMDLLTVESALNVTRDLQLLLVEIFKMHGIFFLQHLDLFKHTNTVFYLIVVDSCASRSRVL